MNHFIRLLLCFMWVFPMMTSYAKNLQVISYELPNGLKLFVQEDHRAPVVVSQVWYKVGSSYEPEGITGISHALEHMMFKGTPRHGPGEFSRIISAIGGQENAMTDQDYTVYYELIDKDQLSISFEMEADRMRHLLLDGAEFAKEIQVVMEERRMRIEDNPQYLTYERFLAAAHIANTYHHLPIGWMGDLQQMTIEDLRRWYSQWYAPNNAILVVVGDVKPDEVHQLALKYFGSIQSVALPVIKDHKEVPSIGQRNVVVKAPAQLPWVVFGYNVPSIKSAGQTATDPYVLVVISAILSSGDSSWLAKDLVRGQQIASSASASYDPLSRLSTLFILDGTPASGKTVPQLRTGLLNELKKLKTQLVSEKELGRVKAGIIADKVYAQDSVSNQASEIGNLEVVGLPWQLRDEFVDKISTVTPEQVQAVAKQYFTNENLTTAELKPLPLSPDQQKMLPPQSPIGAEHAH